MGALHTQAEISRRYSAAKGWIGEQGGLQNAMVCRASLRLQGAVQVTPAAFDAFETIRGGRGKASLAEVFDATHTAVMGIYAGAAGPVDPAAVARTEALVNLFEGACAAQGYRRPF